MLTSEDVVKANTNNAGNAEGIEMEDSTSRNALAVGTTAPAKPNAGGTQKTSVHVSKTAAIILVLAIGVHAFFEGIAFGL